MVLVLDASAMARSAAAVVRGFRDFDPRVLLAERIESLVSQEHAKWASGQQNTEKTEDKIGAKTSEAP